MVGGLDLEILELLEMNSPRLVDEMSIELKMPEDKVRGCCSALAQRGYVRLINAKGHAIRLVGGKG